MAINQSVDVPMFAAGTQHTSGPLTDLSVVVSFQRSPGSDVCPGSGLATTDAGDARAVAAVGGTDELPPQAARSSPQPNTHEHTIRT
jgi:hypothetical protein